MGKHRNEEKENIEFLINIAKDEYQLFFTRSQTLDAKVVLITTIIGAFLSFIFDVEYIQNLIRKLDIYSVIELFLYLILLGIFITIIIFTNKIIMSRKTKFMPINVLDEKTAKANTIELKEILMSSYRKVLEYNNVILKRKNDYFNVICILTLLVISVIIVIQVLKVFKVLL